MVYHLVCSDFRGNFLRYFLDFNLPWVALKNILYDRASNINSLQKFEEFWMLLSSGIVTLQFTLFKVFTSWAKLRSYKISCFFCFFLFLNFSWRHFLNFQISTVLTIFLDRFDGLLLKWDIIIFFSGISSGFRIISGFFRILFKY